MKRGWLLFSVITLTFTMLLFSCTNKVNLGKVSEVKLLVESNVAVEKYVVNIEDLKGNTLVSETFEPRFEPRFEITLTGLDIPSGEYKIVLRGLVAETPVVVEEMKAKLEPGVNSVPFVMSVKATLDVEYYSRAKMFKAYFDGDKIVLRYKKEPGVSYSFFALVSDYTSADESWLPLDSSTGWQEYVEDGYNYIRIPIRNGRIEYRDGKNRRVKMLPVERIVLFGVNTVKDGKPSGISPAPIIESQVKLPKPIRSTPAVWKNLDDPALGDEYGIYVFTTSDDGVLRVFGYKNGKLEELDSQRIGCFGLMSPVVEEDIYLGRRFVNVYVAGYNPETNKSTLYKFTFDPYTYRKLRNTGDETIDGRVESTPVFVNEHLFVATYDGKAYVIRPTDMSRISGPINLGNRAIVTSPAVVGNDVYVLAPSEAGNTVTLKVVKVNLDEPFNPIASTITSETIFFRGSPFFANATASSPAVNGNKIYFGTMDGILYEIAGNQVKRFNLTLGRIDSSPVIDEDGNIYVGTDAGYVVKINPNLPENNAVVWKYYTGNDVRGVRDSVRSTPLLANDGILYVGSFEGYIYALRQSDGQIIWRYQTTDRVWGSPTLIPGEGKLLVGGHDGELFVIRVEATDLKGIWPKFRQNYLNK